MEFMIFGKPLEKSFVEIYDKIPTEISPGILDGAIEIQSKSKPVERDLFKARISLYTSVWMSEQRKTIESQMVQKRTLEQKKITCSY